ncbi:hypothetical protein ABPG72_020041 [Tetrahymena utriculariae]
MTRRFQKENKEQFKQYKRLKQRVKNSLTISIRYKGCYQDSQACEKSLQDLNKHSLYMYKNTLINSIKKQWKTVTPELCQKYMNSWEKRCEEVIQNKGNTINY